jgi:hypothetical protein
MILRSGGWLVKALKSDAFLDYVKMRYVIKHNIACGLRKYALF